MRAGEFVKAVILSCCSVDSQECTTCYTVCSQNVYYLSTLYSVHVQ